MLTRKESWEKSTTKQLHVINAAMDLRQVSVGF